MTSRFSFFQKLITRLLPAAALVVGSTSFSPGQPLAKTNALTLYVCPTGADTNPGTASKPFRTLEHTRDAVRDWRRIHKSSAQSVQVVLLAGDFLRTNALEFTAEDSGSPAAPVTWQAAVGERCRFIGGRALPLAEFRPVSNPDVLARLPDNARSNVLQFNLRAAGITRFGEMQSRGFARPGVPAHSELFYGGKPMTLARWPNEGNWEHIASFPSTGAQDDGHSQQIGKLEAGFFYAGDRPERWKQNTNVWVHGYWAWDWANSYERIATLDTNRHLINTAPPHGNYGFRKGQRFYFLNVLEELDQPGEWFLDAADAVLYFWPPGSTAAGTSRTATNEILLSLLSEPFVKLTGASNVVIRGLTFEAGRGNAVEIRGGANHRVVDCAFRNIGASGAIVQGGTSHGIERCEFFDTGDGGVSLTGGDRTMLAPGAHFVENCRFARQGRWSKCYVPAILMEGVGLRASHNLIYEHPHCAILYTGNDHLIELNEIHHIALETGDVGAIYAGRDYTYRGNRIRHNFIHHTGGVGMGSMGIYMDDCVSGAEIYGNIFYKVQRAAFLGGGRDHRVINNIFVECNHAVELDGRGLDPSPVWRDMVDKFMRQRLAAVPSALYRSRYPQLKSLDAYYGPPGGPAIEGAAFKGVPPENNLVARNICVGKWLNIGWHASPEMLNLEKNLTDARPLFITPPSDQSAAKDFALQPESPAWKLGFERIPVEQIGPR